MSDDKYSIDDILKEVDTPPMTTTQKALLTAVLPI